MLSFTSRKPFGIDEEFVPSSYLLITTGTFQKRPFIRGDDRKQMLLESLDFNCYKWKWRIIAFVILDNHYHIIVQTPPKDSSRIAHIVQSAHSYSAHHWRQLDPSIHSRIWWNFWESELTDLASLCGHINYVHQNPEYHGIGAPAAQYAFSSYSDYLKNDSTGALRMEREYPAADVNLIDSF